jgi:AcrR family transcriptional regulator
MSEAAKTSYHHGDLRATLISTAMGMLERGESFSIRAVAREAGVSATAPYRHFPEREALESALAAEGLRNLKEDLIRDRALPTTAEELAEFGVAYVEFALRRPALFRLMFGNEYTDDEERVRATADVHELLAAAITGVFPDADPLDLALGGWGVVHGLAFLCLDRKLTANSIVEVAAQVRASLLAVFAAQPRRSGATPANRASTRSLDSSYRVPWRMNAASATA